MAFTEDLSIFLDLDGFGVPVTSGVVSGAGILDQNSEVVLGGEATMIDYLLTVRTDQFGSLGYGDLVSVDGVSYKVEMQPQRFDDGAFCRVPLVKVTPDPVIDYVLDGGAAPPVIHPAPPVIEIIYDGGGA
jgi:hypothetical protein